VELLTLDRESLLGTAAGISSSLTLANNTKMTLFEFRADFPRLSRVGIG
jgi:hypothetical protein